MKLLFLIQEIVNKRKIYEDIDFLNLKFIIIFMAIVLNWVAVETILLSMAQLNKQSCNFNQTECIDRTDIIKLKINSISFPTFERMTFSDVEN